METLAILVAAGRGERLGAARPKAFLEVAGQPLLLRAARAFEAASLVDGIIAVVPEDEVENARSLLAPIGKLRGVAAGGARRQDSVLEGLKLAPDAWDGTVLVHDAARPFVSPELIDAVVVAAREHGAALPVLPVVDTIKRLQGGRAVATVDRAELAAAQTPQGFRFSLLVRAYEEAFRDRVSLTDESMAVERLGRDVTVVPGSPDNRKITTPDDLAWAEAAARRETLQ
jgi:2-C-methyl-D-erythritol 4-phosphate cytidylyltransferase